MTRRIVVVGAGLSGLRACEQLRAQGWTEAILVLGDEEHPPYNRPPLTKAALRDGVDPGALAFRQRPSTADVDWHLGTRVVAADLIGRTVTTDADEVIAYDALVIATGVRSRRVLPGTVTQTIRSIGDAERLRSALTPEARVVIIGGGFIGCEVAATASDLCAHVSLIEPTETPLAAPAGTLVGAEVQRRLERHGVVFHLGRSVHGIEEVGTTHRLTLSDGTVLDADVVVEAVGSIANVEWLAGNGLDLTDGVRTDVGLHPVTTDGALGDVVALGDVARFPIASFGLERRIEHWTMPTDTAAHAARSLLATLDGTPPPERLDPLPTFWSDQYGVRIQSFGIPSLGLDDVRVLEGDLGEEAAVGYHRDGRLVGVLLLGLGRQMLTYRTRLVEELAAGSLTESAR